MWLSEFGAELQAVIPVHAKDVNRGSACRGDSHNPSAEIREMFIPCVASWMEEHDKFTRLRIDTR